MNIKFEVSAKQQEEIYQWGVKLDKKIIECQRKTMTADEFDLKTSSGKHPYYGAIGGGLTYSFTVTKEGVIVSVQEALLGETLQFTLEEDKTPKMKIFSLGKEELKNLEKSIFANRPNYVDLTFSFTNTGLGTVVTVVDVNTKEKVDISDYNSW